MIKNIIFDLGGVLIDFNPDNYLKKIGLSDEESEIFKKLIWKSEEWVKGDRGEYTYEQIIDEICKKNPEHSEKLRYVMENKDNSFILSQITENCDYFKELKNKGFKMYFLSNVTHKDLKYDKDNFEIFKSVDGAIYSCEVKCAKPERKCYESLIKKYNLNPAESVFIDDNLENIEAGEKIGFKCVHHKSLEETKKQIEKIL